MYCNFFGLATEPFGISPDSRFFFASAQHVEASASLYYTIAQRRGLAVLIAPPGLGKTSVLVNLAERIAGEARVALFVHPQFEGDAVLDSVLLAMGLEPEADPVRRLRQFHAFLLDLHRKGKTCVVIIDEAQNLSFPALETIRMLSNFEAPDQKLIQFILAGQPGLADLLRAPECEQILQRVNVIARLEPLSAQEIGRYLTHRVAVAGGGRSLFSIAAIKALIEISRGIPRNINTLCFNALTSAFADGKKIVDADCLLQVARERDLTEMRDPSKPVARLQTTAVTCQEPAMQFSAVPDKPPLRALAMAVLTLFTLLGVGAAMAAK
jgi:general secretion pathway protein A